MSSNSVIQVSQPRIETLQVSVIALRVGTKQVTQSVFRQLIEEPVIDHGTCELRGIPWGTVNYHWGNCLSYGEARHPHVVWQKGDELRRCCLDLSWPELRDEDSYLNRMYDKLSMISQVCFLSEIISGRIKPKYESTYRVKWHHGDWGSTIAIPPDSGWYSATPLIRLAMDIIKLEGWITDRPEETKFKDRLLDKNEEIKIVIKEHASKFGISKDDLSTDDFRNYGRGILVNECLPTQDRLDSLPAKWERQVDAILSLPQLFIAV